MPTEYLIKIGCLIVLVLGTLGYKLLWKRFPDRQSRLAIVILGSVMLAIALSPNSDILLSDLGNSAANWRDIKVINPYQFSGIVGVVISIQAIGVLIIHLFSERAGLLFTGFVGGIASSTAITQAYALHSRSQENTADDKKYGAIAVVANGASLIHKLVIVAFANAAFLTVIWPFMLVHFLSGVLIGAWQLKVAGKKDGFERNKININYFSVWPVLWFVIIYFLIGLSTQIAPILITQHGQTAAAAISLVGGLDTTIIEIAKRYPDRLTAWVASGFILAAFTINIVGKIAYSIILGTPKYFKWVVLGLLETLAASVIVQFLWLALTA